MGEQAKGLKMFHLYNKKLEVHSFLWAANRPDALEKTISAYADKTNIKKPQKNPVEEESRKKEYEMAYNANNWESETIPEDLDDPFLFI